MLGSSSPFLVRAVGSTDRVAAAFSTGFENYRAPDGETFFSDTGPARVPAGLGSAVAGVIGLADTARERPLAIRSASAASPGAHYGAGPFGSGLTPSQLDGIYDAGPAVARGAHGQGRGATMAVFELSGYTAADITTYSQKFLGRGTGPGW